MDEYLLWEVLVIAAIYFVAGIVKGGIGLGLPTVSIGLMAVWLPVEQAAGILIIPVILTNIWQSFFWTAFKIIVYRLWPLFVTLIFGSFVGAILISGVNTAIVTALLGGVLALFAISGLTGLRFTVPVEKEKKWNPVIGFITGIISGATAIFVVPVVPYLQSLDFSKGQSPSSENGFDPTRASNEIAEKDALIQALGLTVLISSGALAIGLNAREELPGSIILPGIIATVTAILGMVAGRTIRNAMSLDVFRKWVLAGLLLLGFVMIFRAFLA